MSATKEEIVLKKASIFLTAFLLLSSISLCIAHSANAKGDSESSKEHCVSMKKKDAPPKRKIAQSNAIKVRVKAYYTPEEGQDFYLAGSFKKEKKQNGGLKTFSEKVPQEGMIAVDPKVIPIGTKLYSPELDMVLTAEDTGGRIEGNEIDIYTGKGEEALKKAIAIGNKRVITLIIIERAS